MLTQEVNGSKGFQRRHITGACHYHVGFFARIVAGPFPNADSHCAMLNRPIHVQPLQGWLLTGDDHIYEMPSAQAAVDNPKQRVGIGWEVNSYDVRFFVDHVVDETRILVAKAIVVLSPNMRRKQIVERRDA